MEATCPSCRSPVAAGARFCTTCGAQILGAGPGASPLPPSATAPAAVPPPPPAYPAYAPAAPAATGGATTRGDRPFGVAFLAVLAFVLGVLSLVGAAVVLVVAVVLGASLGSIFGDPGTGAGIAAIIGGAVAFGLVVVGLLYLAVGYGTWFGRVWAWYLAIVLAVLALVSFLGPLVFSPFGNGFPRAGMLGGLPSALFGGLVLWYFLQPGVKAWFRVGITHR